MRDTTPAVPGRGEDDPLRRRQQLMDEQEARADARDQAADRREVLADRREADADLREQAADDRDARADEREARLNATARAIGLNVSGHVEQAEQVLERDQHAIGRAHDRIARSRAMLRRFRDLGDREQREIDQQAGASALASEDEAEL